jgi:hydrogenase maturation protein HypF
VCAEGSTVDRSYPFGFDSAPLLQAIVADLRAGVPIAEIARAFHRAVVDAMVGVATDRGIGTVVLSGGVFQNALLVELASTRLGALGFEVLTHRLVPPNDGGLSLGQAYLAIARHQEV